MVRIHVHVGLELNKHNVRGAQAGPRAHGKVVWRDTALASKVNRRANTFQANGCKLIPERIRHASHPAATEV
eukprot:scaffold41746_cov67-Phaeocystis_antarctica.AAC.9